MRAISSLLGCWLATTAAIPAARAAEPAAQAAVQRDPSPATAPGKGPPIRGSIDPEAVRKVVRAHAAEVLACYEAFLAAHPEANGKVTARWTIGPDGRVVESAAVPEATSFPGDEVPACIAERVRSWTFPALRDGGTAIVTYPWILRPSSRAAPAPAQK